MKNKIILTVIFICTGLLSRGQYRMMTVEGSTIRYKAEKSRSGYTDKSEILGYMLELKSPRDAANGQTSGKRQYQPVILWKNSGASSPQFFKTLVTNEIIKKITLQYYKPDEVYKQNELAYTIEFDNVSIAGFRHVRRTPENPEFRAISSGLYDEIRIVFERMTLTDNKAKTTCADFWKSPNQKHQPLNNAS